MIHNLKYETRSGSLAEVYHQSLSFLFLEIPKKIDINLDPDPQFGPQILRIRIQVAVSLEPRGIWNLILNFGVVSKPESLIQNQFNF